MTPQHGKALAGHAQTILPSGVLHLDQPTAVFEAMLTGWTHQQQSRMLAPNTIEIRLHLLRRFQQFTGESPWRWGPADVEEFTATLLSGTRRLSHSTIRSYQLAIRLFCEFITDQRYDWSSECVRRFGEHPIQICHHWNTVEHLSEFEGRPEERALTYDELQTFIDVCDDRLDTVVQRRRKGALAATRDAQMFKTMYAWSLRGRRTGPRVAMCDRGERSAQL